AGARATGTSHLAHGLPCQDSFQCRVWQGCAHSPVFIVGLADGAGSADRAEVGAQLATTIVTGNIIEHLPEGTMNDRLADVLRRAVGGARLALDQMATNDGCLIDDFASTLLVAVLSVTCAVLAPIRHAAGVI